MANQYEELQETIAGYSRAIVRALCLNAAAMWGAAKETPGDRWTQHDVEQLAGDWYADAMTCAFPTPEEGDDGGYYDSDLRLIAESRSAEPGWPDSGQQPEPDDTPRCPRCTTALVRGKGGLYCPYDPRHEVGLTDAEMAASDLAYDAARERGRL